MEHPSLTETPTATPTETKIQTITPTLSDLSPHGFSNNLHHTIFIAKPNALPRNAAYYTNPHAVHSLDCDTNPFYDEEGVSFCGVQS